jgi:ribosome-binding factor A
MSTKPHRLAQINEFIRQKFGEVVNRETELPEGALVTVTRVKTSKDLRHAKVGLSIYPARQTDAVFAKICRNLRQLNFLTHQEITFRFAPDIKVYIDKTAQKAFEIEELLNRLKDNKRMKLSDKV